MSLGGSHLTFHNCSSADCSSIRLAIRCIRDIQPRRCSRARSPAALRPSIESVLPVRHHHREQDLLEVRTEVVNARRGDRNCVACEAVHARPGHLEAGHLAVYGLDRARGVGSSAAVARSL